MKTLGVCLPNNSAVIEWVKAMKKLCRPDEVFWCDGSEEEKQFLTDRAVKDGVLIRLNQEKLPGCYYHRSHPNDVARVEQATFICTETRQQAGPTNNWISPREMYEKLYALVRGGMKSRTMYVLPYVMGPPGSSLTKVGIQLTDSLYVALSMRIMTRMGRIAYDELCDKNNFNRGLHCMLDLNPARRYIAHFPQDNAIISVGSNYGGNVLLGKKCLALRIGSYLGQQECWMAEHMLIMGVESPNGEKTYVAAAFPSACGKTNFAMLIPPQRFRGWKIRTVGDDIAWMKPGTDGRLYAINPEAGYFGVAPGTNTKSNPNAMRTISRDTIYTNTALTPDLDVWWEGKDGEPPQECLNWKGNKWNPQSIEKAAHPNSRFAAPMTNNPMLAPEVNNPEGVPISAIIFGGRRANTMPLVYQALNWAHGVYIGATMGSETTAAATGNVGEVRRDPMAMLPFCGYNIGHYFQRWLDLEKSLKCAPKIFHVNWFRKDEQGNYLWPGFSENMSVLQWIVQRCGGQINPIKTPIGWMPGNEFMQTLDREDLKFGYEKAQVIHHLEWREELRSHHDFFCKLGIDIPKEFLLENAGLCSQFSRAKIM